MKDKELNDITRLYDRFIRQCPGTEEYTHWQTRPSLTAGNT